MTDTTPRIVTIFLLLIGTLIFGLLPVYIIKKLKKSPIKGPVDSRAEPDSEGNKLKGKAGLITSFLMCFGGGVLFATSFCHLLPEVREKFDGQPHGQDHDPNHQKYDDKIDFSFHNESGESNQSFHSHDFPLPEILVCAGFFIVYFIEEALHAALGHVHKSKSSPEVHGHSHSPSVLTCQKRDSEQRERKQSLKNQKDHRPNLPRSQNNSGASFGTARSSLYNVEANYGSTESAIDAKSVDRLNGEINPNNRVVGGYHPHANRAPEGPHAPDGTFPRAGAPAEAHGHSHGLGVVGEEVQLSISGLLIVVALSFHSVFEGLAIGLQNSTSGVWTMFIAVAIHKYVISFVVGLEVYSDGTRTRVLVIYMIIFAMMSPLGIIIGLVSQVTMEGKLDQAILYLNALAAGTLLYVTFFEVLQREKNSQLPGLIQLLAVLLGFSLMVIVNYYAH